jgi:hypothetical protein
MPPPRVLLPPGYFGWMLTILWACQPEPVKLPETPVVVEDTAPTVLSSEGCASCGGDCLLEQLAYGPAVHVVEPIDYVDTPPAGGAHNPCWAPWGVHTEPVPDENFVHNLEHGGIVWLYACEDCPEIADLEVLADEKQIFALVTRYTEMEAQFAALSWGWRLTMGCAEVDTLSAFYDEHVDQAPESTPVEPAESCM